MPGAPQNPKRAAATITTLYSPETAKKIKNQWKPNISPFPLIPTKATTTTKLAQKLENIRNQWKPCSTSQLLRRQNAEDMILALLDPICLCLNMCPALQGGNPCSAACAQLITAAYLSLEKTMPVSFCQTLFRNPLYISLSSWNNMFFLTSRYVRIIRYFSEVCWRGYTLKASSLF